MNKRLHHLGCACAACVVGVHALGYHDNAKQGGAPIYIELAPPAGSDAHVPHDDHRPFGSREWRLTASGQSTSMTTSQGYVTPYEPELRYNRIIRLPLRGTRTADDLE